MNLVVIQREATPIHDHLIPHCSFLLLHQTIAEALLTNKMGRACRQLTANHVPGVNSSLQEVLVHYNIILRCTDCTPIIQPFWQMIRRTNQMQVCQFVC